MASLWTRACSLEYIWSYKMASYFLVAVARNKHWSCDSRRTDAKTITGGPSRLMVGSRHCRLNASFGLLRIQSVEDEKRLEDDSFVLHPALSASTYATLCTSVCWPCIQAVHQLFCYRPWVAYDVQFCWHRDGNSILHGGHRQFAPDTVFPLQRSIVLKLSDRCTCNLRCIYFSSL